jgi:hypothetical protein
MACIDDFSSLNVLHAAPEAGKPTLILRFGLYMN